MSKLSNLKKKYYYFNMIDDTDETDNNNHSVILYDLTGYTKWISEINLSEV